MIRTISQYTLLVLVASSAVDAQSVDVSRSGTREIRQAPAETFTGDARVEMLFDAREPSHASGGTVSFEPGARTAWHAHPRGQILIVTTGEGRVQLWGEQAEIIRAGDVVRIPAGVKHWHGAAPDAAMTHLAVSEHRNGTSVEWMEHVSDEQYRGATAASTSQAPSPAAPAATNQVTETPRPSGPVQQRLAPGLAVLTDEVLYGDVWERSELSARDRSLVTVSILVATGKTAQLPGHLRRALSNGVQPIEASGVLAHLAIYSGWPNAVSALAVYEQVFDAQQVDTTTLHQARPALPAWTGDAARAHALATQLGGVAPKFVELTNDVVFDDLWRRSDLSVRDRSLVTIVALAAMGEAAQLDTYLRRGLEAGLTRGEIAEALIHLGFYAGWPRATEAISALARTVGG
jgi:4-carboxymuconolactone decarboxylase